MSRQGKEPESQMVLKRPRQEDRLARQSSPTSIPMAVTPRIQDIDLVPAIRGVHEHMSTWMSSPINAQDGCLQVVAQRASMGRAQQEHLAQQVAQRSMMPSMTDQASYLRAQLAHRAAQLEQVRAEQDNQFVQEEEEVLAHMRLLSSEAKDWKSRVVIEAEEVLCRESAQIAQQATEAQEVMDQHYKLDGSKQKQILQLYVNPTAPRCSLLLPRCMRQTRNIKKLYTAQERQIQLEAQALREVHQYEQQAAQTAQEYQNMVQELRRQADEQPDLQKLLWRRQLSQQADYRAEIHELHTELLNMKDKSEMKSHLAANICRIDHTVPSRDRGVRASKCPQYSISRSKSEMDTTS